MAKTAFPTGYSSIVSQKKGKISFIFFADSYSLFDIYSSTAPSCALARTAQPLTL
jgi:hypothetical protein